MHILAPISKHRGVPGQPGSQTDIPDVGFILHLDLTKLLRIGPVLR